MAEFTPVALGIKPPQGMSLGDMLGIARNAQAYRQAEQVNPLALEQAQETTKQTKLKTEADTMGLQQKRYKHIADSQISMINNPLVIAAEQNPNAVDPAKLADLVKRNGMTTAKALGIDPEQANQLLAPYVELATTNPSALRQYYKERHIQGLDEGARTSALGASGVGVNTGAGGYTVQTGEFGPQPAGAVVPGTAYTSQLPPTQQLVSQAGDGTGLPPGTPYVKGPAGAEATGAPKMATGISSAGASATNVTNEDWAKTQKAATEAQPRIAIFQNIKKFAPDAFTGTGGARKELAAGILNAVGISAYEAEKVSTEELAKNSALLAMAGGNTDAARALAEIANPSKKLNERAIKEISNQMIGIEKMNQSKAQFLSPVAQDSAKYQERLNVFNQVADPRLFQEATTEDVAKMKARMSKAEQADFGRRVQLLKQMGLTQ
jgi:hypothetical protein